MASFFCHAFAGTKQVRLERIVSAQRLLCERCAIVRIYDVVFGSTTTTILDALDLKDAGANLEWIDLNDLGAKELIEI